MGLNNVKIIIGSHGSGKSNWIYNYFFSNAVKTDTLSKKTRIDINKKFLLVVPEQDTAEKQRIIMEESCRRGLGAGIINIDVVSFDRMAHNVFDVLNIEPKAENVIEDDAKTMILMLTLSKLYREGKLKYYKKMINKIGFAKKLTQVVSEFYSYNVKSDDIDKVIESSDKSNFIDKLSDLKLIYEEFKNDLKKKNFSIREDKYNLLNENIEKVNFFNDMVVAFDGFTGFTPVQLDIFKKICKVAKEVYVTIDIRDTDKLYNKKSIDMVDVFYLSEKFINDIAKALATVNKELPFENYIDLNIGEVVKFASKKDLAYLEKHIYNYTENIEKINSENIFLFSSKNIKMEVKNACDKIIELVRKENYKYNDIRIIVPVLSEYNDIMLKTFNKYNIPIFVDDSTGVFNSPYIEAIRASLDIIAYDFQYDSVMRYINSGIFEKNKKLNLLDNHIRKYGIRGHKGYQNIDEDYDYIFSPLLKLYSSLSKDKNTVNAYLQTLKEFIIDINLKEKFNEFLISFGEENNNFIKEKKILDASVDVVNKTFENIEIINLNNDEVYEIEEFKRVLDVGFESVEIKSIPFMLDQVVVGDFMRSRFDNPKVCFLLGLNQSKIPATTYDLSIIDDNMRIKFDKINIPLSQTTIETALNQRFYTYLALTNPTEKLFLSYTMLNSDDTSDEKSSIILEVERVVKLSENRSSIDNVKFYNKKSIIDFIAENIDLAKKYYFDNAVLDSISIKKANIVKSLIDYMKSDKEFNDYFYKVLNQSNFIKQKNIQKELINDLILEENKDGYKASATAIEAFNTCPYNYFLNNTIKLRERDYFEINSMDLGNYYHAILRAIFSDKSFDIQKCDDFSLAIDNAITRAKIKIFKFDSEANKVKYIKNRAKALLITSLKAIKDISIDSKLSTYLTEKSFDFELGKDSVVGRIDVINKCDIDDKVYVNVIDYKSGKKTIKIDDIINGVDIQLMLYLNYCMNEKMLGKDKLIVPCGSFYFTISSPIVEIFDYSDVANIDRKINEEMGLVGIASDNINNIKIINEKLEKKAKGKNSIFLSETNGVNISGVFLDEKSLSETNEKVAEKIYNSVNMIKDGVISKKPYESKDPCKYCNYKNICRKEESIDEV